MGLVNPRDLLGLFVSGRVPWDVPRAFGAVAEFVDQIPIDDAVVAVETVASWGSSGTAEGFIDAVFGSGRIGGDQSTYDEPPNSYLSEVVARGVGIPLSLAVLTVEAARLIGIHMRVIGMPGHVLVGADDGRFFDVFHGGTTLTGVAAKDLYRSITRLDNWSDEFLAPIGPEQQVLRMLNNLKSNFRRRDDTRRLRLVMNLRAIFPGVGELERVEFARLMRDTN